MPPRPRTSRPSSWLTHLSTSLSQITWENALWLHCDLRALVSGAPGEVGGCGHDKYMNEKMCGEGPDKSIVLYAHQLFGETELTYCVVQGCHDKKSTFVQSQRNPETQSGPKAVLHRQTGDMQVMPTVLHGGCMTGWLNEDGGLELQEIEFDDEAAPRVLHASGGAGVHGVGMAVLASVFVQREVELRAALTEIQRGVEAREAWDEEDEKTVLEWMRDGGVVQQAASFELGWHGRPHQGGVGQKDQARHGEEGQ